MDNNYKQKYLKYKQKYLELKSQHQLIDGGFKKRHGYYIAVPEFKNLTNPKYVSDECRKVNSIIIHGVDKESNDYSEIKNHIIKNKLAIINRSDPEVNKFMNLLEANSDKIIEIKGFHNSNIDYKQNTSEGTYVQSSDFSEVFKSDSGIVPKKYKLNKSELNGFFASKGYGKKNLNKVMKEYKEKKKVEYVMLEEAGGTDLVEVYKKYGFKVLLSGYDFYLDDEPIGFTNNSIMFGNIDNIIAQTN